MLLDLTLSGQERLFGLIGCALAFPILLFLAFRRLGRYRLIADTPTALVRSAPQGYVELIGHIIAGEDGLLASPLSGSPCVWYRIRVDRYQRNHNNKGGSWRSVRRETSTNWFQIDDGTGVCLVDPDGASASTRHKRVWYGQSELPGAFATTTSFNRYAANILGSGGRYRYTEELMFEHERLYALGQFKSVGGGRDRLDLKSISGDILRSWKADQAALISRFDADGDGKIDLQEWQQAREQAHAEALEQQKHLDTLPTMHLICDPQTPGQPYILSTHDEDKLIRRFRWQLAGFMACALLSFWLGLELMLTTPH